MSNQNRMQRFIDAQSGDYETAIAEIKNGRKRSHWMWYILPQIQGLGFSETSRYYAIKDINEAADFLQHSLLGQRLVQICNQLLQLSSSNATAIFGSPDDMKLRSSMTLFSSVPGADPVFQKVLDKFFDGAKDSKTLQILRKQNNSLSQ